MPYEISLDANDFLNFDWDSLPAGTTIRGAFTLNDLFPVAPAPSAPARQPKIGEVVSPFGTELGHSAPSDGGGFLSNVLKFGGDNAVQNVVASGAGNALETVVTKSSPSVIPAAEDDSFFGTIGDWFARGSIVILGFIFVAVGLYLFGAGGRFALVK